MIFWGGSLNPYLKTVSNSLLILFFFVKDQLRCHHNYDGNIPSQINGSDVDNRATDTKIDEHHTPQLCKDLNLVQTHKCSL